MNQMFILNYIRKLTREDVARFIRSQNIEVTEEEFDVIFYYIKNRGREFLNGNHLGILNELKNKVSSSTYSKILEYYEMYQDKL